MAMQLIEWLTRRKKPLSQLTRSELRRKELMLQKDQMRMTNRIKKLDSEKQEVFRKGKEEKAPELRRVLAQGFELKTTEQLMISRQLNIRSKEILTVARLRMLRENADRAKECGGRMGMVSEGDILRIGKLIESDSIRAEVYQERLDELIGVGAEVDEGASGLSESGQAVMNIWERMDHGKIVDESEAFDEADRRVRDQQRAAAEE